MAQREMEGKWGERVRKESRRRRRRRRRRRGGDQEGVWDIGERERERECGGEIDRADEGGDLAGVREREVRESKLERKWGDR